MLYDIDRIVLEIDAHNKRRDILDLVYDIETFLLDTMIDERQIKFTEDAKNQERLGRKKVTEYIISEKERNAVYEFLTPLLQRMYVPRQIKGFRILEDCVIEAVKQAINKKQYMIMKLFPVVAEKYNITANNAEKLCRYACKHMEVTLEVLSEFPEFEVLTHRTYEPITLKEAIDALVVCVTNRCKFKSKRSELK